MVCLAALVLAGVGYFYWTRPRPLPPTEIFQGVVYSCERIPETSEGSGLMHLVRVDLTQPGIELYLTPLDAEAVNDGFEYELRWTPSVASREKLAVVVNGAIFSSSSRGMLPGAYARSMRTVVADGQVNHVDRNSYLLWFEEDLTPHLEKSKPPSAEALSQARWAIGGEMVVLDNGKPNAWASHESKPWVLAGIDARRKILYLAAFEDASLARAARLLADRGVVDAIELDPGDGASMVIGHGAVGVRSGTLLWPTHGSATHLGVRAPVLPK